jgi:hypothetical protein
MDEIYEAMRETVAIKDGDRFMAIARAGRTKASMVPQQDRARPCVCDAS